MILKIQLIENYNLILNLFNLIYKSSSKYKIIIYSIL
jgi:hypothetical protein